MGGRRRTESGKTRTWTKPNWKPRGSSATSNTASFDMVKPFKEEDYEGIDWTKARPVGFVNRAGEDLDFFYVKNSADVKVGKIPTGGVMYQITYHNHNFRAKTSASSQFLADVKIT